MRKTLTLKQQRFVCEYIKDGNASRAVKEAYPSIRSEAARRVMGSKLVANGNVRSRIDAILEESGVTPALLATELRDLIESDDKSQKNKAIRTAAEIMGLIGRGFMATQININDGPLASQLDLSKIRQRVLQIREEQLGKRGDGEAFNSKTAQ